MRAVRARTTVTAALAIALLAGCRDATQILLEVTTDVDCTEVDSTSITVGTLSELEDKPPVIETPRCDEATQRIGSTMIVPSGDNDEEVAVLVALGQRTRNATSCIGVEPVPGDCIIARRAISFLPHTGLELPVELQAECLGVTCPVDQTCFEGDCVPAKIPDPSDCAGSSVCLPVSPDASLTPTDAAADGADGGTSEAGKPDASVDSGGDSATDGGVPDAPIDATAPAPPINWSQAAGGGSIDWAYDIAVEPSGTDFVVVGKYSGNPDFGGGTGIGMGNGIESAFVARYAQGGAHRFSQGYTSTSGADVADGVAIDSTGAIYVTGGFGGDGFTFGGSPLVYSGVGFQTDVFIAKLSPTLTFRWQFGGGGTQNDLGRAVAVDSSNNAYFTGDFAGSLQLAPGSPTLMSNGGSDIFVVSYDELGGERWSRSFGGSSGDDVGRGITVAGGRVCVTGVVRGAVTFDAHPVSADGVGDLFVTCLDAATGSAAWAVSYGGPGNDQGMAITTVGSDVAVAGFFEAGASVGGAPLPHVGLDDGFVATYAAADGAPGWSVAFRSAESDFARGVASDGTNIYVAGRNRAAIDLGGGLLPFDNAVDGFVGSYAPGGAHRWSIGYGGPNADETEAVAHRAGRTYVVGGFLGPMSIAGAPPITGGGAIDVFMAEFGP